MNNSATEKPSSQQLTKSLPPPQFTIASTLNEAWSLVSGSKWSIWAAVLIMIFISVVLNWIFYRLFGIGPNEPTFIARFIFQPILTNILIAPFYAGAVMVAIRRARGETVSATSGFQYLHRYFHTAVVMVIVSFLANLAIIIINAPGIVPTLGTHKGALEFMAGIISILIYTFFILSIPLVVDKNFSPGQALSQSVQWVAPHWLRVFALILIGYLIGIIASIPTLLGIILTSRIIIGFGIAILVIAVIWVVPFLFLIQGVIYRHLVDKA